MHQPHSRGGLLLAAAVQGLISLAMSHPLNALLANATEGHGGHWDVTLTRASAVSGYRWEGLSATYSGNTGAAAAAVQCQQLYDASVKYTSSSCDDPSFSYTVEILDGAETWITVQQTVDTGTGTPVAVTGKSVIDIQCGKGGSGRVCEGSARVETMPQGETGSIVNGDV
ncbi:hypothetical protein C8A00DRAFT_33676 [Chaetomidium leptoderma]|uniref:Uncharacterized protein n=1 Tax=Chaetomidium leptoderma TaxID=669021 RepID=A0AAN6VNK2_9PEZI|nr:hypothetical protein C8A00DRAFT_33676 [Chaetomidium leptoderma]